MLASRASFVRVHGRPPGFRPLLSGRSRLGGPLRPDPSRSKLQPPHHTAARGAGRDSVASLVTTVPSRRGKNSLTEVESIHRASLLDHALAPQHTSFPRNQTPPGHLVHLATERDHPRDLTMEHIRKCSNWPPSDRSRARSRACWRTNGRPRALWETRRVNRRPRSPKSSGRLCVPRHRV